MTRYAILQGVGSVSRTMVCDSEEPVVYVVEASTPLEALDKANPKLLSHHKSVTHWSGVKNNWFDGRHLATEAQKIFDEFKARGKCQSFPPRATEFTLGKLSVTSSDIFVIYTTDANEPIR